MPKARKRLSKKLKERVEAKLEVCCEIIKRKMDYELELPEIRYNIKGSDAGQADDEEYAVEFNRILLLENVDEYIETIVPHEFAHLAAFKMYGPEIQHHGKEWKKVMKTLGIKSPKTYHTFDIKNCKE